MKKITLLSLTIFLLTTFSTHAQPKKGDWMVGASIANSNAYFGQGPSQLSVNLNPSGGYFLTNRLAVGTGLGLSYQKFAFNSNAFSASLTPFARYYFSKKDGMQPKKLYLFAEASAGAAIGTASFVDNGVRYRNSGSILLSNLGLGLSYSILPNISIEGSVKMNYNTPFNAPPAYRNTVTPSAGIGFQIYLPGKKRKNDAD